MNSDKKSREIWMTALAAAGLTYLGLLLLSRPIINVVNDIFLKRLMTDPYDENLWELYSATKRAGVQTILETNLRSQEGVAIKRPLGSPKKFPTTDQLIFNIAQLHRLPTPEDYNVDMEVTIGPMAVKPLKITMPIMVAGMAFGLALEEKAKIALARGASQVGTAISSGEGPYIDSERKAAAKYMVMYDRGKRKRDPEIFKKADAVEIQFGQGAIAGIGHVTKYKDLTPLARKILNRQPGQPTITHAQMPEIEEPRRDVPLLVDKLRRLTGGVPIGAKIGAGHDLEKDLEILLEAGVDFIVVDGAEAATKGAPPILQDDFGLPTVFAVNRAARYLEKQGMKGKVTLIASGGLYTPGSFLKMIALGADLVYIGSISLFAMAHTEVLKAIPFEPPPQVVFANSHFGHKLNVQKASQHMAFFLKSCNEEMMEGVKALGKKSIHEVDRRDLAALEPAIASALGLPLASAIVFTPEPPE